MKKDEGPHLVPKSDEDSHQPIQFHRRSELSERRLAKLHQQLKDQEALDNQEVEIKHQLLETIEKQFLIISKTRDQIQNHNTHRPNPGKILSIFTGASVPEYDQPPTQQELDNLFAQYIRLKDRVNHQEKVEISGLQQFIFEGHQDSIKNPIDFVNNNNEFLTWIAQFLESR